MYNQQVFNILKSEKSKLASDFGVEEIAFFGSYARGTELPDSDVDVLVTLRSPTFKDFMGAYLYLEKILNKKVDMVTKHKNLSKRFLSLIEKDLVYV